MLYLIQKKVVTLHYNLKYTNMAKWEELPLANRAQYMKLAVQNGYRDIRSIREAYNIYAEGGPIDDAIRNYNNTNGYFQRGEMIGPIWGLDDMGTWITNAAFNNGMEGAINLINQGKIQNSYKPFIQIKKNGGYVKRLLTKP